MVMLELSLMASRVVLSSYTDTEIAKYAYARIYNVPFPPARRAALWTHINCRILILLYSATALEALSKSVI